MMIPEYFKENELVYIQKILAWQVARELGYANEQDAMDHAALLLVCFEKDRIYPQMVGKYLQSPYLPSDREGVWSEQVCLIRKAYVNEDYREKLDAFVCEEAAREKLRQGIQFDSFDYKSYIEGKLKWTHAVQYIFEREGELYCYYWIVESDALRRRQNTITYMAEHDSLTGLYNRHKLELYTRELEKAGKDRDSILYVMLDINRFKDVNDTYGHHAGDEALVALSIRLEELFSGNPNSRIFRLGGDEFLVIVHGTGEEELLSALERLTEPIPVPLGEDQQIQIGVSIGYGEDMDRADQALYYAKEHGRSGIHRG